MMQSCSLLQENFPTELYYGRIITPGTAETGQEQQAAFQMLNLVHAFIRRLYWLYMEMKKCKESKLVECFNH